MLRDDAQKEMKEIDEGVEHVKERNAFRRRQFGARRWSPELRSSALPKALSSIYESKLTYDTTHTGRRKLFLTAEERMLTWE